jgi:hypothetical protein
VTDDLLQPMVLGARVGIPRVQNVVDADIENKNGAQNFLRAVLFNI